MAIIYTYPRLNNPDGTELIVVSETKNKNSTRLITLAGICEFCDETSCDHSFRNVQTSSLTPAEAVGCNDTLILTSSDASVTITNAGNTIDFKSSGGSGGCPTTYVLKPVKCDTETGEAICTLDEDARNWIFTCETAFEAVTPGYVKFSNNGSPVTYPDGGEGELRDCWYADVWSPVPTGLESCEECCAPPADPVIRGTNCENGEILFEALQSNISGPAGWEFAIDNDCEFGQFTGGETIDCIKLTTAGTDDGSTPILDSIKSLPVPDCGCDCCLYECSFILDPCPGEGPPEQHAPILGTVVAPDDIALCDTLTDGDVVNVTFEEASYCYTLAKVCLSPEVPVTMVPVADCEDEACGGEPSEFLRFRSCGAEEWLWEDGSDPIPAAFRSPGIHYIGDLDGGDTHSFCVDSACCIQVESVAFSGPTAPWASTAPCDFAYETSSSSCDCCLYYDVATYAACSESCEIEGYSEFNLDVCQWGQTIGQSWKPSSAPQFISVSLGGELECCYEKVDPTPCAAQNFIGGTGLAYTDLSYGDPLWGDCNCGVEKVRLSSCDGENEAIVAKTDFTPPLEPSISPTDVIEIVAGPLAATSKCWVVDDLTAVGATTDVGANTWTGPVASGDDLTACECCEQELRLYQVCEGAPGETCEEGASPVLLIDVALVPGWTPLSHQWIVGQDIATGISCCYELSPETPSCQAPTGTITSTVVDCEDAACNLI